ncbi:hypothetical protein LshimejAT787_0401070 [Lyophyllum shimeji]|uniref:Polysaccharide lyase 14 domain-containing protein n=1 Tax=Lyophyllum shimeji TaxID=47721 RepID=A0A9P3PJT7_LYOSH|nr:hypothetical protein LshimejAT787_0401070 [Lyophyllum shimeji]
MFQRRLPVYAWNLTLLAIFSSVQAATQQASAEQIAADYRLSTSTSLPFPSATQSSNDAAGLMEAGWSLGKGNIQELPGSLDFVADPFPHKPVPIPSNQNITGPVLRATYPKGSFSLETGGSQWYNLWNATSGSAFQTMLVSYEVAFDEGFDWVRGGKLPGLRGSTQSNLGGCSSPRERGMNATDCFNIRLMWRKNGAGEVYAHIPTSEALCSRHEVICNSDAVVSIRPGSFGFVSGQWNRISLLVRLNDPPNITNGRIQFFYNDLKAIDERNLQIRTSNEVFINGFYFSTFFGGSDKSWETPREAHTYYRSIRMWGSSAASNLTENYISWASHTTAPDLGIRLFCFLLVAPALALWI